MKQRVTYLLPTGAAIDPTKIKVDGRGVAFLETDRASEEWQVKLELNELPDELRSVLEGCDDLHLRWSSARPQELFAPLTSRLPPGLHAFFTPRSGREEVPLFPLLKRLLGKPTLKCSSLYECPARSGNRSESPPQKQNFQWHAYSPIDGRQLGTTVLGKVCDPTTSSETWIRICNSLVSDLDYASHVDLDFDTDSLVLTFTALWSAADQRRSNEQYREGGMRKYCRAMEQDRLEIGVLQAEASNKPEQLTIGGHLLVVGQDKKPSQTHFSFPSRHHSLSSGSAATFETVFQHPTGLHPKLQIIFPAKRLRSPQPACRLQAYFTLPSALFVDRFQLADSLFLKSQNLIALHDLAGADDLEAPDWVTPQWGSAALLELAVSEGSTAAKQAHWTVTIPLHLRYIDTPRKITDARDEATVEVPWPIVFWSCPADDDVNLSNNPFDRVSLGFDGLFDPKTIFYHVPPSTANESRMTIEEFKVPILNADKAETVQIGTLVAVTIGFAWVCWKLLVAAKPIGMREKKAKAQ